MHDLATLTSLVMAFYGKNTDAYVDDGTYDGDGDYDFDFDADGKDDDYVEGNFTAPAPKPTRKSTKGRQLKRWDRTSSPSMRGSGSKYTDTYPSRRRPMPSPLLRLHLHARGHADALGQDRCSDGASRRSQWQATHDRRGREAALGEASCLSRG